MTSACGTYAGVSVVGVDISIRQDDGTPVPFDNETMGELWVRGPYVVNAYLNGNGLDNFEDGWFKTGDVAVGSPEGYFVIADRSKDLIKSGGEWISSVDMEADIMGMKQAVEAAVVAMPDPKWQERPAAFVVEREDGTVTLASVRAHLETNRGWARWQLPDVVTTIGEIPKTSVGKFDKKQLRLLLVSGARET